MRDYPLILLPLDEADGGGWLAVAPDLWGCLGDGDTPEAALADFREALRAWGEVPPGRGEPMPAPGSFLRDVLATLPPSAAAE